MELNESQFAEIQNELQKITKLLAMLATKGQKQNIQIKTLSGLGFQPKDIADLLGTTPNTVRVALHGIRKKKSGSKKQKDNVKENDE